MRDMFRRLELKQLVFRVNHRSLGRQTTKLPLTTLQEYSLRELCQWLFLMINNDVISSLRTSLSNPERLLYAVEETNRELGGGGLVEVGPPADTASGIVAEVIELPENTECPGSYESLVESQSKPEHPETVELDAL